MEKSHIKMMGDQCHAIVDALLLGNVMLRPTRNLAFMTTWIAFWALAQQAHPLRWQSHPQLPLQDCQPMCPVPEKTFPSV